MKVKMLTLDAGPDGIREPGKIYEMPEKEGRELIKRGYAVDAAHLKPARRAAPERATGRRGQAAIETDDTQGE